MREREGEGEDDVEDRGSDFLLDLSSSRHDVNTHVAFD